MIGLTFLAVLYFIKWLVDEISKPEVFKVDQLINTITEKKPVKYISNGVELKTTLKRHYFHILDTENGKVYNRGLISF